MNHTSKKGSNNYNMSSNEQSLGRLLNASHKEQDDLKIKTIIIDGDENLDSMETKPLKILDDEGVGMTKA
jgi:hypothetical protein